MSGDLISRAKAIAMHRAECSGECGCCKYYIAQDLECGILHNVPAVDAEPVRHSRWKNFKKQNRAVCMAWSFERNLDENFGSAVSCPNCGAKMDGGADG